MGCIEAATVFPRPKFEVADVFRQSTQLLKGISYDQWKVVNAIINCRGPKLGGHKLVCHECGYEQISYNSCRNRHCPKCQASKQAQWVYERTQELLPIKYFHIVFTVPAVLNSLILQNKRVLYDILFRAANETLQEAAGNPKNLGAKIGFIAILHTWSQNLLDHPHLHCIVTGGGLSRDKSAWIKSRNNFFISIHILNRLFRGKYLHYLKQAYAAKELSFFGKSRKTEEAAEFAKLLDECYAKKWVVYAKKPFSDPLRVLKYIGRYTHRVAISNKRILNFTGGNVSFIWKDYRDKNRKKVMTLGSSEFMRRFLLHVLPEGFKRIRFYGLLSNGHKNENLKYIRRLLCIDLESQQRSYDFFLEAPEIIEKRCPRCNSVNIQIIEIPPEEASNSYWNSA
jgi:predicted Zn-ribbon and HTH transcriptional regulator